MSTYARLRAKEVRTEETSNIAAEEPVALKLPPSKSDSQSHRVTKRSSHDLYIDQVKTLNTKTRAYFLMNGENKTLVQMIREAIDEYIERNQ
jgi:hypothetical protein